MSTATTAPPGAGADARTAAAELAPVLAAAADRQERDCRMPADVAAAMAGTGLSRMLVPRHLGGMESTPVEFAAALETCGRASASGGWCVMISASTAMLAGWLEEPFAAEVFGDPAGCWAGAFAPTGRAATTDRGFELTGRWSFGSGCDNATWFGAGAFDDGGFALHFVPAREVTIHPNWDVLGLRGTGSHDWSVDRAEVPAGRQVRMLDGSPVSDAPLYRVPLFGMLAAGIAAVGLGVGAAALDSFTELAGGKVPALQSKALAQRAGVQAQVGVAVTKLASARAHLHEQLDAAYSEAVAGAEQPSTARRVALRGAAAHASLVAAEVTSTLYTLAGGTSIRNDHPLGRLFRDAHVVTQHIMVSGSIYEVVGRAALGIDLDRLDI